MKPIPLHEAEARLAELIDAAAEGEDVRITRGDGATFRLTPVLDVANESEGPGRSLREDVAQMQERIARLPVIGAGTDEALIGYDDQGLPG